MRETIRRARLAARLAAERWARALAYGRGTLSRDQAARILWDCQATAGWLPLETLSTDSVLEAARERWADCPELAELAADAAERVGDKWNSSGDLAGAAEDWALDLIGEYAERDGVTLVELDPEEPERGMGARLDGLGEEADHAENQTA
jgi:hypothetical protein